MAVSLWTCTRSHIFFKMQFQQANYCRTVSMAYGRPTMTSHLARVPLPGSFDLTSGADSDSPSLFAFYTSTIQLYAILDIILSDVYKAWDGRSNESTTEAQHGSLDVIIRIEDQLFEFESSIPSSLNWTVTSSLSPKSATEEIISRQRNVLHSRYVSFAIPQFQWRLLTTKIPLS